MSMPSGSLQPVTVVSGTNTAIEAGYYPGANISGHVFIDNNNNGANNSEPNFAGVKIGRASCRERQDGSPVLTDPSGNYTFPNLIFGETYSVYFTTVWL